MRVLLLEIINELSLALTTWGIDLNNHITIFKRSSLSTIKALVTKLLRQCDTQFYLLITFKCARQGSRLPCEWTHPTQARQPLKHKQLVPTSLLTSSRIRFVSCVRSVCGVLSLVCDLFLEILSISEVFQTSVSRFYKQIIWFS